MDVLMDEFSLLCKAAPVDSPSQQGSKVVFLKLGLRAGLDLGWKSKIMEASMGCSGPAVRLLLGIKLIFHILFLLLCVNWLELS
jgi:hypothetical protein